MAHLIDKDALVEEIEKYYNECLKRAKIIDSDYWNAKADAYRNVLAILNDTLEVKEVDLEEELKCYCNDYYNCDYPKQLEEGNCSEVMPHIVSAAKHFFELGLKAQKGE